MRLVYIDENDHELFLSDVDSNLYNFFLDHMDTFKQMWEEQGKSFWIRFVIAFRDYVYYKGQGDSFIEKAELGYSIHDLAVVGDGVFINIVKQFIVGRINDAQDFIEDIVRLAKNRHLLLNIGKKSIVNNPMYIKDVRDSFRKLFLYPQLFPLSNQDSIIFHIGFASPIYLKFCGGVTLLLKRWLNCKTCLETSLPVYWPVPSKWMSSDYHLSPFQCFLFHIMPNKLDEICGVAGMEKALTEKISALKSKSKSAAGNGKANNLNVHKCGVDPNLFADEMKERKIFLMAKKQFEEEAKLMEASSRPLHSKHRKKKNKNAIRRAFESTGNDADDVTPQETLQKGDTQDLKASKKVPSRKECASDAKTKESSLDAELRQISENIDLIKSKAEEEGSLDFESFRLIVETGRLLTRKTPPEDDDGKKKPSINSCSYCWKKEDIAKTFKKCSRCKVEKVDNSRYYCSRECQIADWEEWHRKEHYIFKKHNEVHLSK